MKSIATIAICGLLAGNSFAKFESWTNRAGKSADLELVKVIDKDGEKAGEFMMRNGTTVTLKESDLSAADAPRLLEWKPSADGKSAEIPSESASMPSVFDKYLEGNLLKLSGKSLKRYSEPVHPAKYYLFYYTASWCGPCQKFTPSLVEFYDANKPGNNDFELVLVSSDSDEDAMEEYAVDKQMQWPQLKMSKVDRFKKEFKHPGGGIPNLVLTDTQGKILKASYEGKEYKGPTVVMNYLAELLKKP